MDSQKRNHRTGLVEKGCWASHPSQGTLPSCIQASQRYLNGQSRDFYGGITMKVGPVTNSVASFSLSARLAPRAPPQFSCLCLTQCWHHWHWQGHTWLLCGCWDLSCGPHSCQASALTSWAILSGPNLCPLDFALIKILSRRRILCVHKGNIYIYLHEYVSIIKRTETIC